MGATEKLRLRGSIEDELSRQAGIDPVLYHKIVQIAIQYPDVKDNPTTYRWSNGLTAEYFKTHLDQALTINQQASEKANEVQRKSIEEFKKTVVMPVPVKPTQPVANEDEEVETDSAEYKRITLTLPINEYDKLVDVAGGRPVATIGSFLLGQALKGYK